MRTRTRTALVALSVVLGTISMGQASALTDIEPEEDAFVEVEEAVNDTYNVLPSQITDTINLMTADQCALGLIVMESQGYEAPNTTKFHYEYDPISQSCQDFRDALLHSLYEGDGLPYHEYCRKNYGTHCLAIGHYACDFALMIGTGLVYLCIGGLDPYN